MDKSTGKFTITNNGKQVEYDVLFTFDDENTKKNYIVFTDNSLDENNNIKVYANTYNPDTMDLGAIETEKEWQLIENLLADLQEKVGEDDDKQTGE